MFLNKKNDFDDFKLVPGLKKGVKRTVKSGGGDLAERPDKSTTFLGDVALKFARFYEPSNCLFLIDWQIFSLVSL